MREPTHEYVAGPLQLPVIRAATPLPVTLFGPSGVWATPKTVRALSPAIVTVSVTAYDGELPTTADWGLTVPFSWPCQVMQSPEIRPEVAIAHVLADAAGVAVTVARAHWPPKVALAVLGRVPLIESVPLTAISVADVALWAGVMPNAIAHAAATTTSRLNCLMSILSIFFGGSRSRKLLVPEATDEAGGLQCPNRTFVRP
ncbi:MAG: hypothetical protein M3394_00325 [Actinomycetota bacterium]|nr:hypothetical protein [Actinomycetota bacterium]